jgi:hypothetical protein
VLPLAPALVFPSPAAVLRARATMLEAEINMRSCKRKDIFSVGFLLFSPKER